MHAQDDWFISGFHQKKMGKQKKEKNDDVSTTLLPIVAVRANERANGRGGGWNNEEKTWPTSSSNREEKVCMCIAARG